jgi:hypothetical protein
MDFASGIVVLTFILLFFILIWNSIAVRWNSSNEYLQMETDAIFASEALLTTPGEPKSWELGNIEDANAIGLVNGRNELSQVKLEKLVSENDSHYYFVKESLGVQRYGLGITVMDTGGDTAYYEFGKFADNMSTSVVFERIAIMNETPVILRMEVWK